MSGSLKNDESDPDSAGLRSAQQRLLNVDFIWKFRMAPLRECVSNFMSGAKGGLSSALTGDRS